MTAEGTVPAVRRTRGKNAGINPTRIVAAARYLDPETLTIQAVADELGVDRKAVTYHVTDRDSLLELLAVDAFSSRFEVAGLPAWSDWKQALRTIAASTKDALVESGSLATYFKLRGPASEGMIRPAEIVLEKMIEAGFGERDAARALTLAIGVAMSCAKDLVMNAREGGHPQGPELVRALEGVDSASFGALRHLEAVGFTSYDDRRFDYDMDVLLWGLEHLLAYGGHDQG
ncbi:TetR/AcrR family transcriptional regulator C-terminal domain-containing protein [Arthrobacter sp. NPDC056691]|uniref:TetR/AcrR family transcriptional regulator C-terminal domain-containing protein n=1 Tax=Arthrobacter sp. NPDC056691 TaxID=3345913 RepID=UPI00366F7A7A